MTLLYWNSTLKYVKNNDWLWFKESFAEFHKDGFQNKTCSILHLMKNQLESCNAMKIVGGKVQHLFYSLSNLVHSIQWLLNENRVSKRRRRINSLAPPLDSMIFHLKVAHRTTRAPPPSEILWILLLPLIMSQFIEFPNGVFFEIWWFPWTEHRLGHSQP